MGTMKLSVIETTYSFQRDTNFTSAKS